MSSSKELYKRINSVSLLQKMTKTMKLISVSKLMKLQGLLNNKRRFIEALNEVKTKVDKLDSLIVSDNITITDKTLVVVVGSDKGFCGSFNNNVFKASTKYIDSNADIMLIGSKLYSFFNKTKHKVIDKNIDLLKNCKDCEIKKVGEDLLFMLTSKTYDNIVFIYNKFFNTSTQKTVVEDIKLPIKNSENAKNIPNDNDDQIIYESSISDINDFFVVNQFIHKFFNIIYDSLTSENASRMITMNKASDNSDNLLKILKTLYNQSRQASITSEIIEISAGAMYLSR